MWGIKMKRHFLAGLILSMSVFADGTDDDYLKIALGTKAIIEAGFDVSNMLNAQLIYPGDMRTQYCVFITTEITPIPECPSFFPEKNMMRGFISCVKLDGGCRETGPSEFVSSFCD